MTGKFVDAEKVRELFDEGNRPAVTTIWKWARNRVIPAHKVCGHYYFDLDEVRDSLFKRNKIRAKAA